MKFDELVDLTADMQCFSPRYLAAGRNLEAIRSQLSRWTQGGKVIKIHKGLYTLAPPFRKVNIEPFFLAVNLKKGSYVSLHAALHYYDIIPEYVPITTCVTTGRPQEIDTPFGFFSYRHINKHYFWGYRVMNIGSPDRTFIADPEKAILDLVYFTPGADSLEYLEELRLQNLDVVNIDTLLRYADRFGKPKLRITADHIKELQ